MAREVFQAVQAAENKADQLIQEAQRSARDVLKTAEAAVTAQERESAMEHRTLYQNLLKQKQTAVEAQLAARHTETLSQQENVLHEAESRLETAAHLVFERVWNDGNR